MAGEDLTIGELDGISDTGANLLLEVESDTEGSVKILAPDLAQIMGVDPSQALHFVANMYRGVTVIDANNAAPTIWQPLQSLRVDLSVGDVELEVPKPNYSNTFGQSTPNWDAVTIIGAAPGNTLTVTLPAGWTYEDGTTSIELTDLGESALFYTVDVQGGPAQTPGTVAVLARSNPAALAQAAADVVTAQAAADAAQGTATAAGGAATAAQADVDAHEAATGTAVHGLGSASTHPATDFATSGALTTEVAARGSADTTLTAAAAAAQAGADASAKKASNGADFADVGSTRHNLNVPSLSSAIVAATANVAALSGLPTTDGVTLTDGQRILLTAQTAGAQNGPWLVHVGAWTRPTDYPTGGAIPRGRTIEVNAGSVGTGVVWLLTTNGAVTIDTDATTWKRGDRAALAPGPGQPVQMRLPQFEAAGGYSRLAAEDCDIIVVGDSIASLGTTADVLGSIASNPWPWASYKYLNMRSRKARAATSPSKGDYQGPLFAGATFAPGSTGGTGTGSLLQGAGNWSARLTNGQTNIVAGHFASVAVFYTRQVTGGSFAAKDESTNPLTPVVGSDGISGNAIDCAGTQKFSRVAFFNMTGGFGAHTFTITATVTGGQVPVDIEQVVPLYGNAWGSGGVRMIPCTHAGYTTTLAVNDGVGTGRGYCLDMIERLVALNPGKQILIDNMGYNDITANVATDKAAFYAAVRAIDATIPIVGMIPWTVAEKADALKLAATTAGVDTIDPSTFIGNGGTAVDGDHLTSDGVHPTSKGKQLLSDVANIALTGDPLGVLLSMFQRDHRDLYPSAVAIGDSTTLPTSALLAVGGTSFFYNTTTVDSLTNGTIQQSLIFGFPLIQLFKSTTSVNDASAQLWIAPSNTAAALGITSSGPAIVAGVGAAAAGTNPSVTLVLDSSGVWKFGAAVMVGAMSAGTHAANRDAGDLRWPHTLFDHFVDAGSTSTGETTLYTDTIAAGQLSVNGQRIRFKYEGSHANASTRQTKVKFAGTTIADTGALVAGSSTVWVVEGEVTRVSSTVVRYWVRYSSNSTTAVDRIVVFRGEITGLTLSNTAVMAITGQAASGATNDIVARSGRVTFEP